MITVSYTETVYTAEPGICRGNEDSYRNEHWKSRKKYIFRGKKINKHTFFSMNIRMMDLWMQIEGTKLIFIMNFSVLHFFKFASRTPQIAQILVSTFKIFQGGGACPRTPAQISSFFFSLAAPGSDTVLYRFCRDEILCVICKYLKLKDVNDNSYQVD